MIQGFSTRQLTDIPIRAFVKSAYGIMHEKHTEVDKYEITKWESLKHHLEYPCVVFGILRGTGEIIRKCKESKHTFYHFDHAYYFKEQKHGVNKLFGDKIYRITKNNLMLTYIDKLNKADRERLGKFKQHIKLKPFKYDGSYVLVLPPSDHVRRWYGLFDWEKNVVETLKKHTKREIRIRTKDSKTPYIEELQKAHAVVTCQSTACVDAIIEGIPSFCDKMSMGVPVSLTDLSEIENPLYPADREQWLDSLISNQYTLEEITNGYAWKRLKDKEAIYDNYS